MRAASRSTEEQIIGVLEGRAGPGQGARPRSQARDQRAQLRSLESRDGGTEVSEAKRLRQLEDENRRLKSAVADLKLDNQPLKAVL